MNKIKDIPSYEGVKGFSDDLLEIDAKPEAPCYCPKPVPSADGSLCFLCGGDDPKKPVKKVKKKRVKKT